MINLIIYRSQINDIKTIISLSLDLNNYFKEISKNNISFKHNLYTIRYLRLFCIPGKNHANDLCDHAS